MKSQDTQFKEVNMITRKFLAFWGVSLVFLGGSFFSQGSSSNKRSSGPYENLLAESLFARDALAVECGVCADHASPHPNGSETEWQCDDNELDYECEVADEGDSCSDWQSDACSW